MKRFSYPLWVLLILGLCVVSCDKYDDSAINEKIDDITVRVDAVEMQMKSMNNVIQSISLLLEAQKNNVGIVRVENAANGYMLVMTDGTRIPLVNGRDGRDGIDGKDGQNGKDGVNGQDGQDGKDGKDGATPVIGVEFFVDNYYWTVTVNGQTTFLLDKYGNKIPAKGRDGRDGTDGKDGKDGVDGKDGNTGQQKAILPLVKVDFNGYWVISYDDGKTWDFIKDYYGQPIQSGQGGSTGLVVDFYIEGGYYVFILANGTELRIRSCPSLDIPADYLAGAAPYFADSEINTTIPNIAYFPVKSSCNVVYSLQMTGIQNPFDKSWLDLKGTGEEGQNMWIDVDGDPKGFVVSTDKTESVSLVDLVFLVDNSGSMSDEANAIARDIMSWASSLSSSGLDIRFACVGYGSKVGTNNYGYLVANYGVSGAIDFTDSNGISTYLNRTTGTSRTVGYSGSNASFLSSQAALEKYSKAGGECGIQALRFADENFTFRKGANRIYVNFTDDANYHGNSTDLKVAYLKTDSWDTNKGTIHTVFSGSTSYVTGRSYGDDPRLMSEYTGGTVIIAPSNFSGVSLSSLPVTGAMQHSCSVYISNLTTKLDEQPHDLRITIMTPDGKVKGRRTFQIKFTEQ